MINILGLRHFEYEIRKTERTNEATNLFRTI